MVMDQHREAVLDLLRCNRGFSTPESWIDYAISHNFQRVSAESLVRCPDCGFPQQRAIGQYVYYSTLVRLCCCEGCDLIYADTRIDPEVIRSHFETTYKDEEYFLEQRSRVFAQLSTLVDRLAPPDGSVLDVGGAKGHLLAEIKRLRPDLRLVLNDLSGEACRHGERQFGLETVRGDVPSLAGLDRAFHVVVMSDVIYYEPDLRSLWETLPRLVHPGGAVVIRIPNKAPLIRLVQLSARLLGRRRREMQQRIRFFNPEHLYLLTRGYLTRRLERSGFEQVSVLPAELLGGANRFRRLWYRGARVASEVSGGRAILTPGCVIVARRSASGTETEAEA